MNYSKNESLTNIEAKKYSKVKTLSLALAGAALLSIVLYESMLTNYIGLAIAIISAAFLMYTQKKFNQNSDLKMSFVFILGSICMAIAAWTGII